MNDNDGCVFVFLLATIFAVGSFAVGSFYGGMGFYRECMRQDAVKNNVGYYSCDQNGNVSFKWKLPKVEENEKTGL